MQLADLLKNSGEWLRGDGPEHSIVISSRVRLARNLSNYRFAPRITESERLNVAEEVRGALDSFADDLPLSYFDLESMSDLNRRMLVERHLISREQEEGEGARGVALNDPESISVMINEEDHIRLQSLRSGLQLDDAYDMVDELDDRLSGVLDIAYDKKLGFLTACPTNVGTGMRVSVMMHLPALVMTRHIEKAFRAIHDLRLAVRGLYGEGTEAHGEFYQISNQITLGRSEQELIDDLRSVIESIVAYENKARDKLLDKDRSKIEDRVWRAYGTLGSARMMNSEEAMRHLSSVRLGINLGILPSLDEKILNMTFICCQPAHLQCLENKELASEERDVARARLIRERMRVSEN